MSIYRLSNVLAPRSVALVGASPRRGSLGAAILNNIRSAGFAGEIGIVNPRYGEIDGVKAASHIDKLPFVPELVVITAPAREIPEIIDAAGKRGTAGAVIVSAGLGHGPGSLAEAAERAARSHRMRLIGPNCLGIMMPGIKLNASFAAHMPRGGNLALISQSGAIAAGMVDWAEQKSVGFSGIVSVGDQLDVDIADLLDHFCTRSQYRRDPALHRGGARRPKIHVGGPCRGAHQADRGGQVGPDGARRPRRGDPYRRAGGSRRRLRRRIPPRRYAAGVRPARTVRLRRDARPDQSPARQAARHADQRRRSRRARGGPAGRTRRRHRGAFGYCQATARCGASADLVWIEPGRHHRRCRCGALCGGTGNFADRC